MMKIKQRHCTPADEAKFEDVGRHVGIEHFNKGKVHVHCLQEHPGERGQQEEVLGGCHGNAEGGQPKGREPGVNEENKVEAEQSNGEVQQDLRWVITPQLPE